MVVLLLFGVPLDGSNYLIEGPRGAPEKVNEYPDGHIQEEQLEMQLQLDADYVEDEEVRYDGT